MSAKKNTAGSATSTAANKEISSPSIIPFDDEKVKEEAVKKPPEIQEFEKQYQHYLTEVFNEKRTQRKLQQSA